MTEREAIQDQIPENHCYGCGPKNERGLQIKSYWNGENETVCEFTPSPHHCAGPTQYLNGGIIATVMDCHTVCTAIADGYRQAGRATGSGDKIWYATGKLDVQYRAPALIDEPAQLTARILERTDRKTVLTCELKSGGRVCATADVIAVRVPDNW